MNGGHESEAIHHGAGGATAKAYTDSLRQVAPEIGRAILSKSTGTWWVAERSIAESTNSRS
jgi:hypothetical protein